jgi:hypothetical protein
MCVASNDHSAIRLNTDLGKDLEYQVSMRLNADVPSGRRKADERLVADRNFLSVSGEQVVDRALVIGQDRVFAKGKHAVPDCPRVVGVTRMLGHNRQKLCTCGR